MKCIVCNNNSIEVFKIIDKKKYWKCNFCLAKFLDKAHYLNSLDEKSRYLEHNNEIKDVSYRSFLSKLSNPLKEKLSIDDKGLEFGCGHGPALADMLKLDGFDIELYDPFFFPNNEIFLKKYDFITCTETAEHFYDPFKEFNILNDLLIAGGWLGLMTCFMTDDSLFENWQYRKDPTHVVFYTRETLEVIAAQRNWTCEIAAKDIALFCKK